MTKPTLVVMAAGVGTRYGGLKQVEPIGPNGEIILDYSIFDALQAGFGKIIFIIKKENHDLFHSMIGQKIANQCEIVYVYQELEDLPDGFMVPATRRKPWGTGHAVLSCNNVVDMPFGVINADDFYGRTSFGLLCSYLKGARDPDGDYNFCAVGYKLINTLSAHGHVARGVCRIDDQGYLVEVRERLHIEKFNDSVMYTEDGETWFEIPSDSVVSMNMWGFTPELFPELEERFVSFLRNKENDLTKSEFLLPDVVNQLLVEKKAAVKVLPSEETWFGLTYQEDLEGVKQRVRKLIKEGAYPEMIWDN